MPHISVPVLLYCVTNKKTEELEFACGAGSEGSIINNGGDWRLAGEQKGARARRSQGAAQEIFAKGERKAFRSWVWGEG